MLLPSFVDAIMLYDDDSSLQLQNGGRFVRKLPDDRSLGYLHKIYAPLTIGNVDRLRADLQGNLPVGYAEFLAWANGASLFDNTVQLYGYVKDLNRSLNPEKLQAISLEFENRLFCGGEPDRWEAGWIRIGGISAWNSKYHLEMRGDGLCSIGGEAGRLEYVSLSVMLDVIMACIGPLFSPDGIRDASYTELETSLPSLLRRH